MKSDAAEEQGRSGSITTRNVGLAAGAIAAYKGELSSEVIPGGNLEFTVAGLPTDFSVRVARGDVQVSLREMLVWTNHLLSLIRESRQQRGGRA
jgi:hypothetical protein